MTLVRWRPYGDFVSLQDRINRLFRNDLLGEENEDLTRGGWMPLTDIVETEDHFVFKIEVPGIAKKDIDIKLENNTLTVKGERKEEKEVQENQYHRTERCCGSFLRSFSLPQTIDEKKVDATMKDGILEVKVPKKEESKPKAIPISIK